MQKPPIPVASEAIASPLLPPPPHPDTRSRTAAATPRILRLAVPGAVLRLTRLPVRRLPARRLCPYGDGPTGCGCCGCPAAAARPGAAHCGGCPVLAPPR